MFGVSTITTPKPRRLGGTAVGAKHKCGTYGELSVREIAEIAGTTPKAIQRRIRKGWRGEALCQTKFETKRKVRATRRPAPHQLVAAIRMARLFGERVPTITEIQAIRPMSRSRANEWRSAYIEASRPTAQHGSDEG